MTCFYFYVWDLFSGTHPLVAMTDLLPGEDGPERVDHGHAQRLVDVGALLPAAGHLGTGSILFANGFVLFRQVPVDVVGVGAFEDLDELVDLLQDDGLHRAFAEALS